MPDRESPGRSCVFGCTVVVACTFETAITKNEFDQLRYLTRLESITIPQNFKADGQWLLEVD